jgi:hypothetical protein
MQDSSMAGEVMKRARMLLNVKGQDALEYANQMLKGTQKTYDKEEQAYWHRIVMQIELLIDGDNPALNSPI